MNDKKKLVEDIGQSNMLALQSGQRVDNAMVQFGVLAEQLQAVADGLLNSGLADAADMVASAVERISALPEGISQVLESQDNSEVLLSELQKVTSAIKSLQLNPSIKVSPPDLAPVARSLESLSKDIKAIKIPENKVDLSSLEAAIKETTKTIKGLSFPTPNYVLPFKDSNGAATQLQLNSSGTIPSGTTSDNITTGTIVANGDTVTATAVSGMAGWTMAYYGTYATGASLTMEASFDGGSTYSSVRMLQGASGTLGYVVTIAAVANSTSYFVADIPTGATHLRVRCSAWAAPTGTINVIIGQSAQRFATPNGAISITAGTVTTLTTLTNITNWGNVVDNGAFVDGTTRLSPNGYIYDEVAGTALTENDAAAARIDVKRAQIGVIEDATTRGQRAAVSAGGALKVDNSAVTQPVSGTVTANAGSGTYATLETQPATGTLSNVTMTGSSVTLKASNTSRRNLMVYNDSGVTVYVKLGSAASSTSFTVKMLDQSYYELPAPVYTGIVTALGASGDVRVTETT